MKAKKIDVELANELFYYDESSPSCLRRKIKVLNYPAGSVAGRVCIQSGYWVVKMKCKLYRVHRLILAMNGACNDEDEKTDHINGNKLDNRIDNLRIVEQKQNTRNKAIYKNNAHGSNGIEFISLSSGHMYWRARWNDINGKQNRKTFRAKGIDDLEAKQKAIDFRCNIIAELNKNGAGYTERHGK